jgi:hypothetical protein
VDDRFGGAADHAADAMQLRHEMLAQAAFARFEPVEVERFVAPRAAAADIGEAVGVERRLAPVDVERAVVGAAQAPDQFVRTARVARLVAGLGVGAQDDAFAGHAAFGRARFEQRILGQLVGDHRFDFEVRQRQQLDRRLQLLGHHQRLRNTKVEAWAEPHRSAPPR